MSRSKASPVAAPLSPKALAQLGRTRSEETRAKMSAAQTGKVVPEETRARMSAAQQARHARVAAEKAAITAEQEAAFKAKQDRKDARLAAKVGVLKESLAPKKGRPVKAKPTPQPAAEPPKAEETKPWHADTHLSPEDKAKWEIRKHEFTGVRCKAGPRPLFEALVKSVAPTLIGTPMPEGYEVRSAQIGAAFLTVTLLPIIEEPAGKKYTQSPYEVAGYDRYCESYLIPMRHMMMEEEGFKPALCFEIPNADIKLSALGLSNSPGEILALLIARSFDSSATLKEFFDLLSANEALVRVSLREGIADCLNVLGRKAETLADYGELTTPSKFFMKFKEYYKL